MIRLTQGFNFALPVKSQNSVLAFISPIAKYVISDVLVDGSTYALIADKECTSQMIPGKYAYQLQDQSGVLESGDLFVMKNIALAEPSTFMSIWQKALRDIDDIIAGRAQSSTNSVTVGDKTVHYSSLSELLKLRDYILARLREEQREEGLEVTPSPDDERRVKFFWR